MVTRYFNGIFDVLSAKAAVAAPTESIPELVSESTPRDHKPTISPKRRRHLESAPKQPSAKEHAQSLLDWIYANVDLSEGPITHSAIIEFYTEMLIEEEWAPRPWNPVAHQFRRLTTGDHKAYAWITTTTGALHRLRIYPVPARAVDTAASPEANCNQVGPHSSSTLRRAA